MVLSNATPGPWRHNDNNPTRIIGPDDQTVCMVYGGKIGYDIQYANGHLIASIPDMLAYIQTKAEAGDSDAQSILTSLDS